MNKIITTSQLIADMRRNVAEVARKEGLSEPDEARLLAALAQWLGGMANGMGEPEKHHA